MPLWNATASFSQTSYGVFEAVDGVAPGLANSNGWAIGGFADGLPNFVLSEFSVQVGPL